MDHLGLEQMCRDEGTLLYTSTEYDVSGVNVWIKMSGRTSGMEDTLNSIAFNMDNSGKRRELTGAKAAVSREAWWDFLRGLRIPADCGW